MALPRRLTRVGGYIYIKFEGVLPYETVKDRTQLIALGQLYLSGIKKKQQQKSSPSTVSEKAAMRVIIRHSKNNYHLAREEIDALMQQIAKKQGKEIIAMSLPQLERILDEEMIAGEIER